MRYRAYILSTTLIPVEVEADCLQSAEAKLKQNLGRQAGDCTHYESQVVNTTLIEQDYKEGEVNE